MKICTVDGKQVQSRICQFCKSAATVMIVDVDGKSFTPKGQACSIHSAALRKALNA